MAKTNPKRSINAKNVARDVIDKVRKGEKINLGKIILKRGYSKSTSVHPNKVTETESYKEEVNPFVGKMFVERDRAIKALAGKIGKAKYRDLVESVDKLTKNIQLLSGDDTEKIKITGVNITIRK